MLPHDYDLPAPSTVQFRPDGRTLAASSGRDVAVWPLKKRESDEQSLPGQNGSVHTLAFSPNGEHLAVGTAEGPITLWAPDGGPRQTTSLAGPAPTQPVVAVAPSGERLAAAGCVPARFRDLGDEGYDCDQGTISVWTRDRDGRYRRQELNRVHTDFINSRLLSGWAVAGLRWSDGLVTLWDLVKRTHERIEISSPPEANASNAVMSVGYSPNRDLIGIGKFDGTIAVWDVVRRQEKVLHLHQTKDLVDTNPVNAVGFASDGVTLVTSDEDSVDVWNTSDGGKRSLPAGERSRVRNLALDPSAPWLFVADEDGRIESWNLDELEFGRAIKVVDYRGALAVSGDGAMLAIATSSGVDLRESGTGRRLGSRPLGDGSTARAVAFGGPSTPTLLLTGTDAQMLRWELSPSSLMEHVCAIANRNLSQDEWDAYLGQSPFPRQLPVTRHPRCCRFRARAPRTPSHGVCRGRVG